jgi:glutathionylspermidine synthase
MIRTVLNMSSSLQQVIVDTHYEKKIESTKTVEVMKPIISRGGGGDNLRTNYEGPVLHYDGHLGDIGNSY